MRTALCSLYLFVLLNGLFAQQRPNYTQYVLNTFVINPAVAGIENYSDLKLSHRRQWVGIDGAPVTTYLTFHSPLHQRATPRENPTSFHPSGENPRGSQYWNEYTATDPHAGVGFTVLNDRAGPINRFSAAATYAYHLPLTQKMSISAGVSAGLQSLRLNTGALYFGQNSGTDPVIGNTAFRQQWKGEVNAGIWVYSDHLFGGIAAQNIIPSRLFLDKDTVKQATGKLVPHLFFTAGYRLLLNEDLNFLPSLMVTYLQPGVVAYHLNGKLQYRDLIWAGASVRYKDGYSGMLGLQLNNSIHLGYSYDVTTSALKPFANGSHEVLVGFLLGNNFGDWCPRNVW